MERTCAACGQPFMAKRSTAKYCGSSCRARVATGAVVPLPNRPTPAPVSSEPALVVAVRAQLDDADRATSPLGLAALELAMALADANTQPGAKATLAKQLEATLVSAMKGAKVAQNPVDKLREQRDRKRAHA